jgi:hypothetical protein
MFAGSPSADSPSADSPSDDTPSADSPNAGCPNAGYAIPATSPDSVSSTHLEPLSGHVAPSAAPADTPHAVVPAQGATSHEAHGAAYGDSGAALWRRPPATVWIVVPFSTVAGLDDRPCELPGHGWVSAAHAREIMTAEGSVWHTLYVDEPTGQALRLTHPGYRPTAEIIRHVRAVDGECRGPACVVPAHRCDLDHDIPAPQGATSTDNLTAKHRRHHRVRTAGVWSASRDPDVGTVTWTTAAGRTYTTHPKDWLEHHRVTADSGPDARPDAPSYSPTYSRPDAPTDNRPDSPTGAPTGIAPPVPDDEPPF